MTNRFALLRSTFAFVVATGATLLVVAGSAAPVNAAPATDVASIAISTSGIDLASPAGAARIQAEIGRAARNVCTVGDQREPAAVTARARCIMAARANAQPQFNALTAAARDARTAVADAGTTNVVRR